MIEPNGWSLDNNGEDYFYITDSPISGKGTFPYVNIPENTVLYTVNKESIPLIPHSNKVCRELTLNHCCQPNVTFNDNGELVSILYIFKDDELTLDYSLIAKDERWKMNCTCNDPDCRGVISYTY